MEPVVITARIPAVNKTARDRALAAFHAIYENILVHEPEVLRYVITVPIKDEDETDIYMIEEYASQKAMQDHIDTPLVQSLIKLCKEPGVLSQPVEANICTLSSKLFRTPIPDFSSDPGIILAHYQYDSGTLSNSLEGWSSVVDYIRTNEKPTLAYMVLKDLKDNMVRTVEIYESWDFVEKVHLKSPAIA